MIILRGFLLLKCLIFLLIYFVNIQYYIYIKALFLGGGKSKKGINAKRRTYFLKHA